MTLFSSNLYATHIKAGEITVRNIGGSLTYEITLNLYLDSNSVVADPSRTLYEDFAEINTGDGNVVNVPRLKSESMGDNTIKQTYVFRHSYALQGGKPYIISYQRRNRNANVVNITTLENPKNSENIEFYIQSEINTNPWIGTTVTTPILDLSPVDNATPGEIYTYNPGARAGTRGDSLSFELIPPKKGIGNEVNPYTHPGDPVFGGTSVNGTPSTFTLNPVTGDLIWDTPPNYFPFGLEEVHFNIAIKIIQWKK